MMTEINDLLKKKAHGFIRSIEAMPHESIQTHPTEQFGNDYNKLLDLVLSHNENLAEFLPPRVQIEIYGMSEERLSVQKYNEIHTFCCQIIELI